MIQLGKQNTKNLILEQNTYKLISQYLELAYIASEAVLLAPAMRAFNPLIYFQSARLHLGMKVKWGIERNRVQ